MASIAYLRFRLFVANTEGVWACWDGMGWECEGSRDQRVRWGGRG